MPKNRIVKTGLSPRPEHPRPLLERKKWASLNGIWKFCFDDKDKGIKDKWYKKPDYEQTILVPYAYQTELSGINDQSAHELVWYSRTFTVPSKWKDENILLHFGAVDYYSTVWINGQEIGNNIGGSVPFSFDVTPYLKDGDNTITLRVFDPQDPQQPRGKQSLTGLEENIFYHNTTGIWQSVWLEAVPTMRIDDVRITPIVENGSFSISVLLHAPAAAWTVEVLVSDESGLVTRVKKNVNQAAVSLDAIIPQPILWSPENPHLYTFTIRLYKDASLIDEVLSYGGLRSIKTISNKILLNDKPLYLAMVLDQGYWPGGGLTAPTDQDLKSDVELIKQFGFNSCRKHQKVEDPRWLYWCDKLGLLVWGEMPNAQQWSPRAERLFLAEWERVLRRDYNNPSIITWVPINESWGVPNLQNDHPGQFAYVENVVMLTRRSDSTRLVVDNDGWEHTDITDICAIHDYTPTSEELLNRYRETLDMGTLPKKSWLSEKLSNFARTSQYQGQPIVFSEVGGFLTLPPDTPETKLDKIYTTYTKANTPEDLLRKYDDLMKGLVSLKFLNGFCYTQLTDIAQEMNGLLSFDRQPKISPKDVKVWNERIMARYLETHR